MKGKTWRNLGAVCLTILLSVLSPPAWAIYDTEAEAQTACNNWIETSGLKIQGWLCERTLFEPVEFPPGTKYQMGYYVTYPPGNRIQGTWFGWVVYRTQSPPPNSKQSLSITTAQSNIPSSSRVVQGKVLTTSKLSLTLKQNQAAVAGKQILLTSNRGSATDLISPSTVVTDANGQASALVSTRVQPGTSTISGSDTTIDSTSPGVISWLPAKYENEFLVTCYHVASEADAPQSPVSQNVCGLPPNNTYRAAFLRQTQMQGSGKALDGTFIHYNKGSGCFNTDSCARTATGACAAVGTTIAVDPNVIPKKSTVSVGAGIGQRIAQDVGGDITGYHIDEYLGAVPKSVCDKLGRRHANITFISY